MNKFIERYRQGVPWSYDHPLEQRSLERSCGIIIWQEQVVQIIADVGGMTTAEADEIRRVFVKVKNGPLLARYKTRFMEGATRQGVTPDIAERIWAKINGHYMFPESHSYAFGINAYQAAWLKCYYPVEFFTALFNNLPMGFYPTEVIKQDSKRFGVPFLNPDINKSHVNCIPYGERVLLGFRFVKDVGAKLAASILEERERNGIFGSVGDFVQRAIMKPAALQSLVMAGTFDAMQSNRRLVLWETGLYSGSLRRQLPLPFIMDDDVPDLSDFSPYQRALSEYAVLGIYPKGHLMEFLRPGLEGVQTTAQVELAPEGKEVTVAGLVTTRQHPRGENGTVFVTVEDEHFYTQLILWPDVFHRCRDALRSPVIKAIGKVSRWDGTANVIASSVEAVNVPDGLPRSHDWH